MGKINKYLVGASAFSAALLLATSANATVTFTSLSVKTTTTASAQRGSTVSSKSGTATASAAALPAAPVIASASAAASVKSGSALQIQSNAAGTVVADFVNAAQGTFDIVSGNTILQKVASTTANPVLGSARSGDYLITYKFANDANAIFSLDYVLFDPNFVSGNKVLASLASSAGTLFDLLPSNSSGSLSTWLTPGNYTLTLKSSYEDVIARSKIGIGNSSGTSSDHFQFDIAAVPEPATWAMMLVGFGGIGCAMRRARRTVTFATA